MSGLGWGVPLILVAAMVARGLRGESDAADLAGTAVLVAAVLVAVFRVAVVPSLWWRRWRWELRPEELDLRHGLLTEVRTIVPIARVQHVEVRRTPLASALGLSEVVVHTAAGQTEVPAMEEDAAVAVRDRIADLARVPDDL